MANLSLADFSSLINHLTDIQEELSETLNKIKALLFVLLHDLNLIDYCHKEILHDYLWGISDLVERVDTLGIHNRDELRSQGLKLKTVN